MACINRCNIAGSCCSIHLERVLTAKISRNNRMEQMQRYLTLFKQANKVWSSAMWHHTRRSRSRFKWTVSSVSIRNYCRVIVLVPSKSYRHSYQAIDAWVGKTYEVKCISTITRHQTISFDRNHDASQVVNVGRSTGLKHRPRNSVSGLETSIVILPLSHSPKSVCSWAAGSTV